MHLHKSGSTLKNICTISTVIFCSGHCARSVVNCQGLHHCNVAVLLISTSRRLKMQNRAEWTPIYPSFANRTKLWRFGHCYRNQCVMFAWARCRHAYTLKQTQKATEVYWIVQTWRRTFCFILWSISVGYSHGCHYALREQAYSAWQNGSHWMFPSVV